MVRTFDGGIWFGINGGCAITFTGLGGIIGIIFGGTVIALAISFGLGIRTGSVIAGIDCGATVVGVKPNCFCVAANSSSNFRFFNSNNSRCLICSSV